MCNALQETVSFATFLLGCCEGREPLHMELKISWCAGFRPHLGFIVRGEAEVLIVACDDRG